MVPQATPHLEPDTTGRVPHVSLTPTRTDERHIVPHQTSAGVPPRQTPSPAQIPSPASLALSLSLSDEEEPPESSSASLQASRAFVTPNQCIEPELLYGVCKFGSIWRSNRYSYCVLAFGFHMPPMDVFIMRDPLPNVISLPYGKCPPMHVQAPSWRQLLKLMAKLSATQIEPSTEALAVTKGELKLRTVVQFYKVRQFRTMTRTILTCGRFTVPHPIGGRSFTSPLTIHRRLITVIRTET